MNLSTIILILSLSALFYRIFQWRLRISRIRRTMPVIPVLVPPYSLVRLLWPERYQTYHGNWQFHGRRNYDNLGTGIVPLVPLLGNELVYVADAEAVVEMSTNPSRYPKDLRLYGTFGM